MPIAPQPPHRRPSWKQDARSHEIYLDSNLTSRAHTPTTDSEVFSYDPAHLPTWDAPQAVWDKLPLSLTTGLEGWQAAGAAICTGLERVERLDRESINRGWPVKTHLHLARTNSRTTSFAMTSGDMQSPPDSSFPVGTPAAGDLPRLRTSFSNASSKSHDNSYNNFEASAIVDTPPWTPEDIKTPNSLVTMASIRSPVDAAQLDDRLQSVARRSSLGINDFDEAAWDFYINSYKAEISTLRITDTVRFRHIRRAITKMWSGLKNDHAHPMDETTKAEFEKWWDAMAVQSVSYDQKVGALKTPDLEQVKMERRVLGMNV